MTFRNLLRVLVVDDNESVRRSLCQLLRSEPNVEIVSEAVDGADAVAKTRAYLPDVVLLDITMPTMNGLEAARIIRFARTNVPLLTTVKRLWTH